jgi:beta-galactosidase
MSRRSLFKTSLRPSFFALLFALLIPLHSHGAPAELPRERISLDADWRFQREDPPGTGDSLSYAKIRDWVLPSGNDFVNKSEARQRPAGDEPGKNVPYAQPGFDDSGWRTVNLPHDFGIEGPFSQDLPGESGKLPWMGVAWYRKSFAIAETEKAKLFFLRIDGAMSYSSIWLNGRYVGGWPYGYSSYQLDLTPYAQPGKNVLAIRLDNPPDSSRWYPGGGIYRNVWLIKTGPIHFAQWGVQITTPAISSVAGTVNIAARLDSPAGADTSLAAAIYATDALGRQTGRPLAAGRFPAGQKPDQAQQMQLLVPSPQLWSVERPSLYVAEAYVIAGGKVVDQVESTFGFRTSEFTVDKGYLLNGKRVPTQGVCLHHDLGAIGTAINVRALQRQLEILKEMGVNAIRCSHNPPSPELLDLCDRMGLIVMDEFTDTWKQAKKPNGYAKLFDDWSEKDIRAMVRRDRNHPCVVLWSLGNEIPEQGSSQGPEMQQRLANFVREEDPTRPDTMAVSDAGAGYNGFQKGLGVFGYNYKPWEYKKFHEANPSIPLLGSETASTYSSRGEYFFPVTANADGGKSDFQVSSYDLYHAGWATTPDTEFKAQDENPFVMGEFVWTGFDYLGEPTPYDSDSTNLLNYQTPTAKAAAEKQLQELGKIKVPSRSSYFGIVDLAGFKKDRFYLYQARWRPDLKMAHILPHWNWPERVGEVTPVYVYTSGDEGELFLNGESQGIKKKGAGEYRLHWDNVKYEPGELKVVVSKQGEPWAEDVVKTTGPAAKLLLQPDRPVIAADGKDLSYVTVTVADINDLLVPRPDNLVKFEINGPGEIVATDNGDPTDLTTFSLPQRKAFNGLALVIVRGKPGQSGVITLSAKSEGLSPAAVALKTVSE